MSLRTSAPLLSRTAALAAALLLRLPWVIAGGDCATCQPDRRPPPLLPPPPLPPLVQHDDSGHAATSAALRPAPPPSPPGAAAWSDSSFEARNGARVLGLTPLAFSCAACGMMLAVVFFCSYVRKRLFAARDARMARVTRVRVLLEAAARAALAATRPRDPGAPVLGAPLLAVPWPPVMGTPAPPLRVQVVRLSSGGGLELQPARCARAAAGEVARRREGSRTFVGVC
jgi:hypothetical protein